MASPPPAGIVHITSEGAQVARILWELEHTSPVSQRADFIFWASQHYGLNDRDAASLYTYAYRAREIGRTLHGAAGPVPRGRQLRNPDLPAAYRVRAYAHLSESAGGPQRSIPLQWDLARNPTQAQVQALVAEWVANQHRQIQMRRYAGYGVGQMLVSVEIRSLECRTC